MSPIYSHIAVISNNSMLFNGVAGTKKAPATGKLPGLPKTPDSERAELEDGSPREGNESIVSVLNETRLPKKGSRNLRQIFSACPWALHRDYGIICAGMRVSNESAV